MDRLNHRLAEERGAKEKESTATTTLLMGLNTARILYLLLPNDKKLDCA
jgi:hypothetical protein